MTKIDSKFSSDPYFSFEKQAADNPFLLKAYYIGKKAESLEKEGKLEQAYFHYHRAMFFARRAVELGEENDPQYPQDQKTEKQYQEKIQDLLTQKPSLSSALIPSYQIVFY